MVWFRGVVRFVRFDAKRSCKDLNIDEHVSHLVEKIKFAGGHITDEKMS